MDIEPTHPDAQRATTFILGLAVGLGMALFAAIVLTVGSTGCATAPASYPVPVQTAPVVDPPVTVEPQPYPYPQPPIATDPMPYSVDGGYALPTEPSLAQPDSGMGSRTEMFMVPERRFNLDGSVVVDQTCVTREYDASMNVLSESSAPC